MQMVLFVCEQDYGRKLSADFIGTCCYDWAYQLVELVNFCWWSGAGYGFRITFPLPSPLQNRGF